MNRRTFLGMMAAAIAARGFAAPAAPGKVRVGCQANGFPLKQGDFPGLLAALRRMKELGYAGFECNLRFVQGEFGRVEEAAKQIAGTGVEFIGPHLNMQLGQKPEFAGWVESVKKLGASYIVMSGAGGGPKDAPLPDDVVKKKADVLSAIGKVCSDGGLVLAYHNHNPEFAFHNAEINGLAEFGDPKHLHFLIDAGHAHLGGGDPAAFLRKHPGRIIGFHVKTFKGGEKNQVPLGQGDWGFEDLAAAIQDTGWSGWIESEEGGGVKPGNTAGVVTDRDYFRKVFGV